MLQLSSINMFFPLAALARAASHVGSFDGAVCFANANISSTLNPLARAQRKTASATKSPGVALVVRAPMERCCRPL
jgi:hypothetical protein